MMNMLDRYIQEVGRRLPRQNRADLQAEIRSNLEELIEDRAQQSGRAIDEALTAEVLKEYGAPEKVAESYCPTRYLIGPRLYPFFTMVLKIVITVLFAVGLGGFILNYFTGDLGAEFLPALGQYGLEFLAGAISAFGNFVIVFAILERVLPPSELSKDETEWDPAQLNATPNPDEIKRNELIVDILFTVLILAALNLYTNRIGIYWLEDNAWVMIPFLSDAFFSYLPWINLLWVLQVLLDLYLLRQGLWQAATRLASLALEVAEIALAWVMLTGPSLVKLSAADLAHTPLASEAETLAPLLRAIPIIVLAVLIIVQTIEAVQMVVRLVKQPTISKPFLPKT
jgi:hypothetical protein